MRRALLFLVLAAGGFLTVWILTGREDLVPPLPVTAVTPAAGDGEAAPGEGFVEVLRQGLEIRSQRASWRAYRAFEDPDGTVHTELRYELQGEEFLRPADLQRGGGVVTFRVRNPTYRHYTAGRREPWIVAMGREAIVDYRPEGEGVLGQSKGEILHVTLSGEVHVEARLRARAGELPAKLQAEEVRFDPTEGKGSIPGPVRLEGQGWTGTGMGLEADLEASTLVILHDVVVEGTTRAVEDPFTGAPPAPGEQVRIRMEAAGPVHVSAGHPGASSGGEAGGTPRPVHVTLEGRPLVRVSDRRGEATLRAGRLAVDLVAAVARPEEEAAGAQPAHLSSLHLVRLEARGDVEISSAALDATAGSVVVTGTPPDPVRVTFSGASTFTFREGVTIPVLPGAAASRESAGTLVARASEKAWLADASEERALHLEGHPVLEDPKGGFRLAAEDSIHLVLDPPRQGISAAPRFLETRGHTTLESPEVAVEAGRLSWKRREDGMLSIRLEEENPSIRVTLAGDSLGGAGPGAKASETSSGEGRAGKDTVPASIRSEESILIDHDPSRGITHLTSAGPASLRIGDGALRLDASSHVALQTILPADGGTPSIRAMEAVGDVKLLDPRSGLRAEADRIALEPLEDASGQHPATAPGDLWLRSEDGTPSVLAFSLEGGGAELRSPRIRVGPTSGELEAFGGVEGTFSGGFGAMLGDRKAPDPGDAGEGSTRIRCRHFVARFDREAMGGNGGLFPGLDAGGAHAEQAERDDGAGGRTRLPLRSLVAEGGIRIDGARGERIDASRLEYDAARDRTQLEANPGGVVLLESPLAEGGGILHLESVVLELLEGNQTFVARDRVLLSLPPGMLSGRLASAPGEAVTLHAGMLRGTLGGGSGPAGAIRSLSASSDVRIEGPGISASGDRFDYDTASGEGSLSAREEERIAVRYEGRGVRIDATSNHARFTIPSQDPASGQAQLLGSPELLYEADAAPIPGPLALATPRAGAATPSGPERMRLRCMGAIVFRSDALVAEEKVHIEREAGPGEEEPWILEGSRLRSRLEEDPRREGALRVTETTLEGPVKLLGAHPGSAHELRFWPGEQRLLVLGDAGAPAWFQMRAGVDLHARVIEVDLATGRALARRVNLRIAQQR